MKFPSPSSADAVVAITDLSRRFGGTLALDNVSLYVPRGCVFGLVGENGAGKTTLIKHILGLLKAEAGSVRVFGRDPVADSVGVLSRIGYLSEQRDLPAWMRVDQLLRYTQAFYPGWDEAYAGELREQFGLDPAARVTTLSQGQLAKAGLLLALAFRPELLVLDEPSSGLDPVVRRDILEAIIRTVAEEGRTVFFSSHLLDEIERVSDQLAMIRQGKVVLCGPLDEIKSTHRRVVLRFKEPQATPPKMEHALSLAGSGREWTALCNGQQAELIANAIGIGAHIVSEQTPSLDEIFVARAGQKPGGMKQTVPQSGVRMRFPATAIAWEICQVQRATLLSLSGTLLVCAILRFLPFATHSHDLFPSLCILLMGLSLALVFLLFRFTESDRKQRFTGFPSRLFTLPVRTSWLVTYPMLYGVTAVVLVYLGWAELILRPLAPGHFPVGWPSLYLATGMVCFQAVVWTLADFPITRLVVLGFWGAGLTTGWISFSPTMGNAQLGAALAEATHLSVRTIQMSILLALCSLSYGAACWSVERQRRGVGLKFIWPRLRLTAITRRLAVRRERFPSPQSAQLWFEWRRNGVLLPLSVGGILLLIVGVAAATVPWAGRIGTEMTRLFLFWILVLPFALAFIIGQGFGKTSFWGAELGKELGLPLFLAVRPITPADWLAVKLKTAALSAIATWLFVLAVTLTWSITCCDCGRWLFLWQCAAQATTPLFGAAAQFFPLALVLPVLLVAMLATWRLLAANLYLGVLGNKSLFNAAFCFVFIALFAPLAFAGWCSQHPDEFAKMLVLPAWLPWFLLFLVLLKLGLAVHFWLRGRQRGLISTEDGLKYWALWLGGTEFLVILVWLSPATDVSGYVLALLALLALPLVRISLAPLAFARSRYQ